MVLHSSSRVEDVVLDSSIGSGTTVIVANKLGRKFPESDINPDYVKLATNRLRGVINWLRSRQVMEELVSVFGRNYFFVA